jgi:hypothetical protein
VAERTRHRAEGRGTLALAVAGDDDQEPAFIGGCGDGCVDDVFLACHASRMARIFQIVLHDRPFTLD